MITVKNVSDYINSFAPYDTKCQWDNCGVLVGDENKEIKSIGFTLDLTKETLAEGIKHGVDMIITHHPVIFKAQKNFLKGNIAFDAASAGITVLSAHTCFDCADGGVNDVLCELLGITDVTGVPSEDCIIPVARIGRVEKISSLDFAKNVSEKFGTVCRVVDGENEISKVAVCGGAGADFMRNAAEMGADAYVTGDMSHHEFLQAKELGITVIAAGHFETENPSMVSMKLFIEKEFPEIRTIILNQSNPVKYIG